MMIKENWIVNEHKTFKLGAPRDYIDFLHKLDNQINIWVVRPIIDEDRNLKFELHIRNVDDISIIDFDYDYINSEITITLYNPTDKSKEVMEFMKKYLGYNKIES